MRIRGAKTELEEAGLETEGMVESTSKLRSEILALTGVDIMDGANQFKSTYAIMDELAAKWENLSDIQQATVTELIAGKRQGNIVSSLMENFNIAEEALETSLNSAGSAMTEHERWQQSLEAQINKLKSAWQGLSQAFLKSDFLKKVLNGVINLVDGLTALIDKVGAFPVLLGVFAGLKGVPALFTKLSTTAKTAGISIRGLGDVVTLLKQAFPKATELIGKFVAALKKGEDGSSGFGKAIKDIFAALKQHWIVAVVVAAVATLTGIFGYQAKQAEKLSKKVEELTDKYKEQHEELKKIKNDYDTTNESSMISKYEKLSKGVDHYGRNISLTAEEYSEYQDIVNKIADQFPALVSGYDEQGNALLSCKGNVEELTAAYKKLIHAQNQAILTSTGDIEKDFENTLKKASGESTGQGWWSDGHGFWKGLFVNLADTSEQLGLGSVDFVGQIGKRLFDYELKTDTVQAIQDLINAKNDDDKKAILEDLKFDRYAEEELRDLLPSLGYDVGFFESPYDVLEEALENDSAKLQEKINQYYTSFAEAVEKEKTIAQAKLSEAFDVSSVISGLNYGSITEELQTLARQTVANLDLDFFEELNEQGKTVEQWTTELLNQLNTVGKDYGKTVKDAFELQTQFNGGDINYGDYVDKLKEVEKVIDELNLKDEAKTQLKISLGLDDKGVVDQYDALIKRLTTGAENSLGLDTTAVKKFIDDLSAEEFSILTKIVPNLEVGTTLKEIQSLINDQLAQEFKFNIEVQTEGVEAFNTALAESRSAAGLTSESIAALKSRYEGLDGFNAAALFEKTANGIHLNSEELSRLEEQYVATNKLEIDKNLNTLITKYNDLTDEIKGCTDAQKKEELQLKSNAYKKKIDELSTLASQYDGLTSAFAKWQTALDGAEEGDNYDSLYENLESIKELYDKGLVGTDKFKTAAQLMTNKDLSNADIDEIVSAYEKGYPKMQRYFTEGQKGCKNFLNDVANLNSEWAHMNKDGSWEINFNTEEVAKELGVSVDFVLQIAKKLKDYGFEVNLEDSSVKNLQTEIEKTEEKLKELGQSPVDINVDIEASSSNLEKIESEIEKAKNKIKEINSSSVKPEVKTAQLEDAQAKLEALIDKKQEASQPAYMNLNTSQVNASLVDALEKVQSYQKAINEVNKLSELKEAGITIDDSQLQTAKEKVDECAKAIQGLDGDVKVAIGLEEDGSIDSIKKAFEEGKVKIDANTDPAVTKIEQLAENVERIEDKDVTINVTVNGLDQVKELNKQIDLATDIDGNIDKLSDYVENAKELSKLGNNITSKVTADVQGNVIKTPERKINNLKVFSDSAKDVNSIGHVSSKVTADIDGNIFDNSERTIDNLKVYTDSAKNIKEFEGNISSKITADIEGDVFDKNESTINNLEAFVDSAKGIKEIEGNIVSNITANTLGSVFTDKERSIDNLDVYIESAKGIRDIEGNIVSNITADVNGNVFTDSERTIDNLKVFVESAKGVKTIEGDTISNITANTLGNVFTDSERTTDNLKTFIDSAKGIKEIEGDIVSNITANTLGSVFTDKERSIDNLKVFTESAKGIKEIEGDIVSNITANTLGSVFTDPERETNNLKVFVDSAKGIKDIEGDIVSNITANTLGSVFTDTEKSIDNLKVFIDSAKGIKEIEGNTSSKITADIDGNVFDKYETTIDNLGVFVKSAKNIKNIEGDISSKVTANVYGNILDSEDDKISNLGVFADNANKLKGIGNFSSSVSANATGNIVEGEGASSRLSSLTEFKSIVSGMTNQTVTVSVTAKVDSENVNAAIDLLKKVSGSGVFKDYNATVQVGAKIATIDDTVVKNYKAPSKDSTVKYSVDPESSVYTWTAPSKDGVVNYSASVDALTDAQKHKTGTITYKANIVGLGGAAGTAHVSGSTGRAFAQGNWGIKGNGVALGGELGTEVVVRNGKWFTIGDKGAEFFRYKKNDIVFNAAQTESLFKYGGIKGANPRGKMLATGTAFAEGTSYLSGTGKFRKEIAAVDDSGNLAAAKSSKSSKSSTTSKSSKSSTVSKSDTTIKSSNGVSANGTFKEETVESTKDKFEEVLDWIETILDRAERAIDKYEKQANNVYKTWDSREKALDNQISAIEKAISLQTKAKDYYNGKLDTFDWGSYGNGYVSKIEDGTIAMEEITDENLSKKIKEYQDLYEKYLDTDEKIIQLEEDRLATYEEHFNQVQDKYDGILQGFDHTETMLNEYISQAEEQGYIVSKKYYDSLIANENSKIAELRKQQADLIAARDKAEANGIDKNSQAWYINCYLVQ